MRLRSIPLLALAALPALARAQTATQPNQPTLEIATGNSKAFNQAACEDPNGGTAVTYDLPAGWVTGAKLTIFATDQGSCPDTPPDTTKILLAQTTITSANKSNTLSIKGSKLEADCPSNTSKDFLICAVTTAPSYNTYGTATDQVSFKVSVTVSYDSMQPAPPTLTEATGGDSAVFLTWDAQDGVDHWLIYYRTSGPPPSENSNVCQQVSSEADGGGAGGGLGGAGECDGGDCPDAATPAGLDAGPSWDASPAFDGTGWSQTTVSDGTIATGVVRDLVNDQQYEFVVVAVDAAGNVSAGSNAITGTPLTVHDFYRRYRCSGGTEAGGWGCSTAAGALLVPTAALVVLAVLRRRRAP